MINEKILQLIEEIENNLDKLTDWEREFICGNPDKSYSMPIKQRPWLSLSQERLLGRIYSQRIQKEKWINNKVDFDPIDAVLDKEQGYIIHIAGNPVGHGVSKKEASIINIFLSEALDEIRSIPEEEITSWMAGADEYTEEQ